MGDALFDIEPIAAPPDDSLSADRKRTQRQRRDISGGYHPLLVTLYGRGPWAKLHPDAPKDAEPGQQDRPYTCGTCIFRDVLAYHTRGYPKCIRPGSDGRMARVSHGAATDVRAWWPACRDWTPPEPS